jgi:cellulose synthase/poly-beta-1,6-N-acetylglucosamine synthase-like glycosyltransferase
VREFREHGVRLAPFPERRGKICAINDAIGQVDADVVVFSDANAFLAPGAIRALVANFADPSVGAVSGDVVLIGTRAALATSEDLYYRYERWLQRVESEIGSMIGVDGALYALRRSLFEPPPGDTILDDFSIPMGVVRMGYRVVFEPQALAHEEGSLTAMQEFSRKARIVAGAAQFLGRGVTQFPWRQPQALFSLLSHKILRWLSPALAIVNLASAVWVARHSTPYLVAVALHGALLAAGLLGSVPALRLVRPIGIAHYFCLVHAAAGYGFLKGLLGLQATTWERFDRRRLHPDSSFVGRATAKR